MKQELIKELDTKIEALIGKPIQMIKPINKNYILEYLEVSRPYLHNIIRGNNYVSNEKLQSLIDKIDKLGIILENK